MKWPNVLLFLWFVYHSCAEGMPDKWIRLSETRGIDSLVSKLGSEPRWTGEAVSEVALDVANYGTDPDLATLGPGTLRGARRYLQHDAPIHLFFEYLGWCRRGDSLAAGYHTFLRVFRKVFRTHLQFRKRGGAAHAECSLCNGLKQELRLATAFSHKREILEKYTTHLLSQWLDRHTWWATTVASQGWFWANARVGLDMSYTSMSLSVAAVIADSMDQAKFRIPRSRFLQRASKAFEALHRPAAHVYGVWLQGAHLDLWVSDEDLRKDSCTQIEGIARMIQKALDRFGHLPLGLHLQQDNCSRECKNTYMMNFMVVLVLLGVFKWAVLAYLRKGHTHESIDQVPRN